jgi:lantibiotic biosynthesis protein
LREWIPILSGQDAKLAGEAINAITDGIVRKDFEIGKEAAYHYRPYEDALLYTYLAITRNEIDWAYRAAECLNASIDRASEELGNLGLFGGLAGLGWMVEHISGILRAFSSPDDDTADFATTLPSEEHEPDLLADIDEVLLHELDRDDPDRCYDLISGLTGFGVYFLERWPRPPARQAIEKILIHLERFAETSDCGITWRSQPDLLPDSEKAKCRDGYYNIGVAHGIPGIICLLSQISELELPPDRCQRLLDGAVSWLITHQLPTAAKSRFSSWVIPGEAPEPSRLGWCYGDLGIAAVLLQVARQGGKIEWQTAACELLDHCLARTEKQSDVHDAPLCHGAAGVAHIFNRIYQSEGVERCREAAVAWYRRALVMRQSGSGVGGFASLTVPDPSQPVVWEANPGFVDGAMGVALALLAAITPIDPCWDRSMLLSSITARSKVRTKSRHIEAHT